MFPFYSRVQTFYFITTFGSALSSVATFLNIERHFHTLNSLAIALALRTLAAAFISYNSSRIIKKIGLKRSFLASQLFGCMALFPLFYGFYKNDFILTICGIMLTGLAPNFLAILLTVVFRFFSQSIEDFRKYSGQRELVFWLSTFAAFILIPFLLIRGSYNFILIFDAVTYVIGTFILFSIQFTGANPKISLEDDSSQISVVKILFNSTSAHIFLVQTFASLLLAGLTPLLASSSQIELTRHLPILLRESMWSIEALMGILASAVYVLIRKSPWKHAYTLLLMTNGLLLFIPLVLGWKYTIIFSGMTISVILAISFMRFRDDFVLKAGNDAELIKAYASISLIQKNFVYFLSPIFLGYIFSKFLIDEAALLIFLVQLFFIGIYISIHVAKKNLNLDSLSI